MNQVEHLGAIFINITSYETAAQFINPYKAGHIEPYFTIFESFVKQIFILKIKIKKNIIFLFHT